MAKETCADCGGPRESDSPWGSYCVGCGNNRQRGRYAHTRELAGQQVNHRSKTTAPVDPLERRRRRLIDGVDRPGKCDACGEYESDRLILMRVGDKSKDEDLYGGGLMFALWCKNCSDLSKELTQSKLVRAHQLADHLRRAGHSLENVLPDMNDVIWGRYTPSTPSTPSTD